MTSILKISGYLLQSLDKKAMKGIWGYKSCQYFAIFLTALGNFEKKFLEQLFHYFLTICHLNFETFWILAAVVREKGNNRNLNQRSCEHYPTTFLCSKNLGKSSENKNFFSILKFSRELLESLHTKVMKGIWDNRSCQYIAIFLLVLKQFGKNFWEQKVYHLLFYDSWPLFGNFLETCCSLWRNIQL